MTHIRNAQGNNLSEVVGDTINQVVGQFSEGINAMFSGFKSFSKQGFEGFNQQGQQVNTTHNTHPTGMNEPPSADSIHAGMLASQRVMDSEIEFGAEDVRAVSQTKQIGAQ